MSNFERKMPIHRRSFLSCAQVWALSVMNKSSRREQAYLPAAHGVTPVVSPVPSPYLLLQIHVREFHRANDRILRNLFPNVRCCAHRAMLALRRRLQPLFLAQSSQTYVQSSLGRLLTIPFPAQTMPLDSATMRENRKLLPVPPEC